MERIVKALAFDVGGSVFDWKGSVIKNLKTIVTSKGVEIDFEAFAMGWRLLKLQTLAKVKNGSIPRINADEILKQTLDELLLDFPDLNLSESEKIDLHNAWHTMPVWDEFPDALERLKSKYYVFVLTILSMSIAVDSSKFNGITWDAVISCEFLSHYKTDPGAYIQGTSLLNFKPSEVMMVAVHPADLTAAKNVGMKTGFVEPKGNEPDIPGLTGVEPDYDQYDVCAKTFQELADKIC
jgi:2-haloacid dehalogenase